MGHMIGDYVRVTDPNSVVAAGVLGYVSSIDAHGNHWLDSGVSDDLIGPLRGYALTAVEWCEYSLTCRNEATVSLVTPLGIVPACTDCQALYARLVAPRSYLD